MSNFTFLEKEWPLLAKIASTAENYFYNDSNTCLYKLGVLAEQIVSYMCDINGLELSSEKDNQAGKIKLLKMKRLIPSDIDNILYALRINRNHAVHANLEDQEKALLMLELSHRLCLWFNSTYGKTQQYFFEYKQPQVMPNYQEIVKTQELEISELRKSLSVVSVNNAISLEQRRKKSEQNANLMTLSEKEVRFFIDEQLRKSGWEADTSNLRFSKGTRPIKNRYLAIAEWPTNSSLISGGFADYALFIGEMLVAFIDAKKPSEDVAATIDVQIKDYAKNIKPEHMCYVVGKWGEYNVPFLFASNGRPYLEQIKTKSGIWFLDSRRNSNLSYPLQNWFSPLDLEEKLKQNEEQAIQSLINSNDNFLTDKAGLNLRDYQVKAIDKTTQSIIDGKREILLAMATGTGKTRTILGLIYKMLECKRFNRILFLVDRVSLGEQAMDTFKDVKLRELLTLDKIYEIKDIDDNIINCETKVSVSTIQGLVQRTIINEKPDLMPGAFDLIIVDEAHRGYILDKEMTEEEMLYDNQDDFMSKYRQVIEYFDAVKVGLTATPALHTTEIFGKPIFTYSYREAVIDGYLVDHEPPYIINTDFNTNNVKFKNGEQIAMYDPNTNELINGDILQDEIEFEVSDFNKKIILPDHTKKALLDISKDLNLEGREKTLIFAVDDKHADQIVDTLRAIYEPYGIDNDAIMKITGKTAGGNKKKILQVIKQFKNNLYPNIAVTVDLLTTGIDVPSITNIVFMRKINSRILFEQMIGRATRLCPEISKTHFNIYDPAKVYADLGPLSTMKSVTIKKDMTDLVEELTHPTEKSKQQTIDRILVKLQRKNKSLTDEQKYDITERLDGKTLQDYIANFKLMTEQEKTEKLISDLDFLQYIESLKNEKKGFFYSEKEDKNLDRTRGYGSTEKPEDYIEAFSVFIKDNQDKIEAIKIACTKPSELSRAELKSIKLILDKENFNETNLNNAMSSIKNVQIVADIIAYIRQAILNTPIKNRKDRVENAFEKLIKNNTFNKIQLDMLEKISTYMIHESILNKETFEAPAFINEGGFNRFNVKFEGKLLEIIKEINTYIYEERGVA